MHSAIYTGRIWHHRHLPRTHKFSYRVFMMYLDLSELDEVLQRSRLWSTGRFAPARFCRSDYFACATDSDAVDGVMSGQAMEACSVDECVRAAVRRELDFRPSGAIRVLTNFRYFGYLINPISCYYCFDEAGEHLQALLIEVTNTPWTERTHYVLDLRQYTEGDSIEFNKDLHVSPFMPMNMQYRWKGSPPGEKLRYSLSSFIAAAADCEQMENMPAGSNSSAAAPLSRQFDSGVNFERVDISARSLNGILWRYPWMTGKVALAIYWQAFQLWLKRIPFVTHPDKVDGS